MVALAGCVAEGSQFPPDELTREAMRALTGKVLTGEKTYVLYADVLGFKQKLERDPALLDRQLETALIQTNFSILARIPGGRCRMADGTTIRNPIVGLSQLNPASVFSDSVFVVTHDDSPESLRQLAHVASTMFVHFFSQELPLRGAISSGGVWWNRNTDVRLGPGIKRAYELAESLDCIGIALQEDLDPPENSAGPVNFAIKTTTGPSVPRSLRIPLQLERDSLPMAFRPDLAAAFAQFADKQENRRTPALCTRYKQSMPIIEVMAGRPVRA